MTVGTPLYGQTEWTIKDNVVYSGTNGAVVGYIEGNVVKSFTGSVISILSNFNNSAESVDLSFITAQSNDIRSGKIGADTNGNPVRGTLPEVSATLSANTVTVPAGIHGRQTLTVPEANAPAISGNIVTVNVGYYGEQKKITVGTAKAAATITPGTSDQTIAADTYLSGKQTIKGDANLIAENIKSGVSIFNIEGTFEGTGGGGAVDLYKCVSVNGDTWTGRKAVMEDNQYTIQNTVTSGLSCAGGLTVQKGNVYSADGKIRVNSAYNHCLISCPLRLTTFPDFGDAKIVEFGSRAALDYEKAGKDGVGYCVKFGGGSLGGGYTDDAYIIIGNLPKLDAFTLEFYAWFGGGGSNGYWAKNANVVFLKDQTTGEVLSTPNVDNLVIPTSTSWEHIAIVRQAGSNIVKIYSNGVYQCDTEFSSIVTGNIKICFYVAFLNPADTSLTTGGGWMNNLMIYDYAKYNTNFTPPEQLKKPEWEDAQTLTVSGAGIEDVNGIYELITPTASGRDRIWAKPNTNYLVKYHDDWWSWTICDGTSTLYSGNEDGEPWESEWWDATDDESGGDSPTVTLN